MKLLDNQAIKYFLNLKPTRYDIWRNCELIFPLTMPYGRHKGLPEIFGFIAPADKLCTDVNWSSNNDDDDEKNA